MCLWQNLTTLTSPDVAALSGVNGWKSEYAADFEMYDTVYVVLDNDEDYKVQAVTDKTWLEIRRDLRGKAKRVMLPDSPVRVKDLCEFFNHYDEEFFYTLAEVDGGTVSLFEPLDLSQPAPPVDWLARGMVAKGDVVFWIGEPGLGKSWLMMDLAVAIAEGGDKWLGRELDFPDDARVLYIDEENPEDVVRRRLEQLGLTKDGSERVRYLHMQGIRLDRYPERLIDEAFGWDPTLIVMDSFTRFHNEDENNAGAMSKIMNEGVMPLSRQVGATVMVLHHVNKSDSDSSFGRSRGSGDLTASPDAGFDIRGESNKMFITNYKTRRQLDVTTLTASVMDTREGVEVTARLGAVV
jgi:hypothetical protein